MEFRQLGVVGAVEFTPRIHRDARGEFVESYRFEALGEAVGTIPAWLQTNVSRSARGVLRGIHYSVGVPGQAKYVTVVAGRGVDYVVDLRPGSPTFGAWDSVTLDAVERRAVFIPVGVGHAFLALEDDTALHYLCSAVFDPATEHGVDPFDPALSIEFPLAREAIALSEKDAAAPALAEAVALGRVIAYREGPSA